MSFVSSVVKAFEVPVFIPGERNLQGLAAYDPDALTLIKGPEREPDGDSCRHHRDQYRLAAKPVSGPDVTGGGGTQGGGDAGGSFDRMLAAAACPKVRLELGPIFGW